MSTFINSDITNSGRELIAKNYLGQPMNFTRIAMGDGYLPQNMSPREMTDIVSLVVNIPISKMKINADSTVIIGGIFSNTEVLIDFYYREIALFAEGQDGQEILYCYGNAGEFAEYIASAGNSSIIEKTIDIVTAIGTTQNVTATIVNATTAYDISYNDSTSQLGAGNVQEAIEILAAKNEELSDMLTKVEELSEDMNQAQSDIVEIFSEISGVGAALDKLAGIEEGATNTQIVQTTGDSSTAVMSQAAVTSELISAAKGYLQSKNFVISETDVTIIDYDADEWNPNFTLPYGATLPTPTDTSVTALAIQAATDPVAAASDDINAYIWDVVNQVWVMSTTSPIAVENGYLFYCYPPGSTAEEYYWAMSEFNRLDLDNVDLSNYVDKNMIGAPSGVAGISSNGVVPQAQLPKWFSDCSTAADVAAKTISNPYYTSITAGTMITVRFLYGNTVINPSLNINGLGASLIMYHGAGNKNYTWDALSTYTLVFTGTAWALVGDVNPPAHLIDGMIFDGSKNIAHMANCGTAADVAAKVVSNSNYAAPTAGAIITVNFLNGNTAPNPTLYLLNNPTVVLPILYRGAGDKNYMWDANSTYTLVCDGTAWNLVGNLNREIWSETEVATGETWHDGQPVYMRSFSGLITKSANTLDSKVLTTPDTDVVGIVRTEGSIKLTNNIITRIDTPYAGGTMYSNIVLDGLGKFILLSMSASDRVDALYSFSVYYSKLPMRSE